MLFSATIITAAPAAAAAAGDAAPAAALASVLRNLADHIEEHGSELLAGRKPHAHGVVHDRTAHVVGQFSWLDLSDTEPEPPPFDTYPDSVPDLEDNAPALRGCRREAERLHVVPDGPVTTGDSPPRPRSGRRLRSSRAGLVARRRERLQVDLGIPWRCGAL